MKTFKLLRKRMKFINPMVSLLEGRGTLINLGSQDHLECRVTQSAPPWEPGSAEGADVDPRPGYASYLLNRKQNVTRPLTPFIQRWDALTSHPMVLQVIRHGHEIPFRLEGPPPFNGVLNSIPRDQNERLVLRQELEEMVAKGAVTRVPDSMKHEGYYSRYFLVPKRDGGKRPILNLKPFNKFVRKYKFRLIGTRSLLAMVRRGDWFTSIDLKDAFFHVPVTTRHRKYLRFCLEGECYQYTCLPFGYKLSPITFSRCVKSALGVLLRKGIRVAWYLDDLLIMAESPELAIHHTREVMEHMQYMGFNINWKKSAPWPSCQASYLGLSLDSVSMTATITRERWEATQIALNQCVPGGEMRYAAVKRLLGLLSSAHQVVPLGLLYMRRLQLWYNSIHRRFGDEHRYNRCWVSVPLNVAQDLNYWHSACSDIVGVPMGPRVLEATIYTDASLQGWGAIMGMITARGLWPRGHRIHINALEMEAVWWALQHFAHLLTGRDILIMTDSMTTKAYINRQGGVISKRCNDWARRIWLWVAKNARSIRALHVPGKNNDAADILSRGGPHADNWSLNPAIADLLWERFGTAQVDLFAAKANHKCPLWFSMSPSDEAPLGLNALSMERWPEGLLYAYPPYSCLPDLLRRFRRENARLILVAPFEPNESWFSEMSRWVEGERLDIPDWPDALSQANGLLVERPYYRGVRLAAWMLTKPGA